MVLHRKHKFLIGGVSSLLVVFIIVSSILTYTLFVRMEINHQQLVDQISVLQIDTQTKFNDLTTSVVEAKNDLKDLGAQVGTIDEEFDLLKAETSADFSGIIEDAIRGVVTIRTDISQGTGFIVDETGYVVTNAHVMEGAKAAAVLTYEGDSHSVSLIGKNDLMDIALLKIDGDFEYLSFGNSDKVDLGENVIAIGNPLGLQFSVTEGIISAVNRPGLNDLEIYIQTDAALNPGNSGGPLIDKSGKVIGLNNFKVGGGESLGFALESNYVVDTVNEIYGLENEGELI